ncbi:MAG: hypothetical protein VB093_19235 [Propionicimonas sp.]|nr:hypothetical protein [Propionicimonas sp.]
MTQPGWRARVRYAFDNWMARGTVAIMAMLGLATVAFVLVMAMVVVVLGAYPGDNDFGDFWDIAWGNLMRTLDPGTMGADLGWGFRLLMLVVTIGGLIIVAGLIGIVSGGFDDKMQQLRKGRSLVLERDHTLILGWSPQLLLILQELVEANASRRRAAIVVLAERDKVEMEDEIREHVADPGRTQIICRTGTPMSPADIRIGNPLAARSVIVLTGEDAADPDAAAIKTVLALSHALPEDDAGPQVVAELQDPANLDAAQLVSHGNVRWLLTGSLIHRLTAQTCRQRGLSTVYTELLDFAGSELYFTGQPELAGGSYLDAQFAFADSTVVGLIRGEEILLNPPADTTVQPEDRLIVIADDDSTIATAAPGEVDNSVIVPGSAPSTAPERTLILGYNVGVPEILSELAGYVPAGSSACVVTATPPSGAPVVPGLAVELRGADVTSRGVLEELDVAGYDHILVLADRGQPGAQATDARTLVTLLHLRDIAERADVRLNVVSEMLDDRNRELAEVTRADDFIVSDRLVGLLLAQVSENERLAEVFAQLFSAEGSEIYLRPVELYLRPGAETDFYTVVGAAAARGETAIGYRTGAHARSAAHNYGVTVNPDKRERLTLAPADSLIVLADDER